MQHIFVSSTFQDMQQERDVLHRTVMPELQEFAKTYGQTAGFNDLRWGIVSSGMKEDDSSVKIMRVCFSEIDRSRPFL